MTPPAPSDDLPPLPPAVLRRMTIDGTELWVLDEGHEGLLYGGNKVRKLHGLLAQVLRQGARDVVTFGAWGSHHVYATAVWGARLGLRTHGVWIRQPETPHVRAMAEASQAACASVQAVRSMAELPVVTAAVSARILAETGRAPAHLPPGGSSAEGTRGWVDLGKALPGLLAEAGGPSPEAVVVASGSGGTSAGLLASGFPVHAVRVGPRALTNGAWLRKLARSGGAERLGPLTIQHGYRAGGYGRWDARTEEACAAGRAAGLPTETTYTAKSLACALDLAREGQRVLYVQTASAVSPPPAPGLRRELVDALGLHPRP